MDKHCLNCENPLHGEERFCPRCGQKTDIKRLSLKNYLGEWFNSFISLESSFAKSLWFTIFRPHRYALEFINGKRKKYTHPYKLFIQTTIFLFLIFAWINTFNNQKQQQLQEKIFEESLHGSNFKQTYFKILDTVLRDKQGKQYMLDNEKMEKALVYGIRLLHLLISDNKTSLPDTLLLSNQISMKLENIPHLYQYSQISQKSLEEYLKTHQLSTNTEIHYQDTILQQIIGQFFPKHIIQPLQLKIQHPGLSYAYILKKTGNTDNLKNKTLLRLSYQLTKLFINPETSFDFQQFMISKMSLLLLLMLPFYTLLFAIFYRSAFNYAELLAFHSIVQVFFLLLMAFTNLLPDWLSILIWLLAGGTYYFLALKKFFGLKTFHTFWRFISSGILYFIVFILFLTLETMFSLFFV